jgi:hypothetical protein
MQASNCGGTVLPVLLRASCGGLLFAARDHFDRY